MDSSFAHVLLSAASPLPPRPPFPEVVAFSPLIVFSSPAIVLFSLVVPLTEEMMDGVRKR